MTRSSNPTFISLVRRLLLVFLLVPSIDGCSNAPLSQSNPIPSSVQLDRAQPSVWSTVGGVPLHLYGHGFEPGTKVQFGDGPPTEGKFVSEQELEIMIPSRLGQIGPVRISVIPPRNDCASGSCAVTRNDLFRYSASQVAFASPPQIIPTGDSSCKDGRLFWWEQRAERMAGVVMFCNQENSLPARLFLFRQNQDGSLGPRERLWTGDMDVKSIALNNCQSGRCDFIILYNEILKPGGTIQVLSYRNNALIMSQKIDAAPEYWQNKEQPIFSGDVNGDKQEDIIRLVSNGVRASIYSIIRQSSSEPFGNDRILEELPSSHDSILAAADLDHDGKTDLITEWNSKRWIVWSDYVNGTTLYPTRLWNEEEFFSSEPGVSSFVKVLHGVKENIIIAESDLARHRQDYRIFQTENGTARGVRAQYTFSLPGTDVHSDMHFDLVTGLSGSELISSTKIGLQYYRFGKLNDTTGNVAVDASAIYQMPFDSGGGYQYDLLVRDLNGDGRQDVLCMTSKGIYVIWGIRSESESTKPDRYRGQSPRQKFFTGTVQSMQVTDIDRDGTDDILVGTTRGLRMLLGSSSGDYREVPTSEMDNYQDYVVLSISEIHAIYDSMSSQKEFLTIIGKQGDGVRLIHAEIDDTFHIQEIRQAKLSNYFCPDASCGRLSSFVVTLTTSHRNQVEIIVSDHEHGKLMLFRNWNMVDSVDLAQMSIICNNDFQLQSADLDGDSIPDLILACQTENAMYFLKGNPNGLTNLSGAWRFLSCNSGVDAYYRFNRQIIFSKNSDNRLIEIVTAKNHGPCNDFFPDPPYACRPEIETRRFYSDLTGCEIVNTIPASERRLCGIIDADGDGSMEKLTCLRDNRQTYLNRTDSSNEPIAKGAFATAGDMNGDGKQDLIVKEDDGVIIYENLSQ